MTYVVNKVYRGLYRDSVQLLRIGEELKKVSGVVDAAAVMATELNKRLLEEQDLLTDEGRAAGDNDLVIAVKASTRDALEEALARAEELLKGGYEGGEYFYTIESALEALGGADIALISIPGEYVRDLALELIDKGIHLHIFSDHVPLEDEIEIKKRALEKGILVMGPEAGTSIISGVGLGFANAVERGPVGIVSASGTGLQELSVLLSNAGIGISHGIGVGGRELSDPVGGLSTFFSIKLLEKDESTSVIAIVSKPPSKRVVDKLIEYIRSGGKKYVACFMGAGLRGWIKEDKALGASTLHMAALASAYLIGEDAYQRARAMLNIDLKEIARVIEKEASAREKEAYIRGLFTGGTLAYEAQYILYDIVGEVHSNTPLNLMYKLPDPWRSIGHTIVDLGAEEFTHGRPHPMIDPSIRVKRIVEEASNRDVGVILLDFVLGYGSHERIIEEHIDAIKRAREVAEENGRHLTIIAHVVGTPRDPQDYSRGVELLKQSNVLVYPSNALASIVAGLIAKGVVDEEEISSILDKYLEPGV